MHEYLTRLLLQLELHPVLAELGASQVELERAEAVDGSVLNWHENPKCAVIRRLV